MSRAVVIGASVAGVRTVQALRRNGFLGTIALIGDEPQVPYDKPPLSKAVLAGHRDLESTRLLTHEQARELEVELILGVPAVGLDTEGAQLLLADGRRLDYDHAVVATGARARTSPWAARNAVHVLRSADDCVALRTELARARNMVVIGAGFIGSEVASTAAQRGVVVTMVDPMHLPAAPVVGDEVAALLAGIHKAHGVHTRFGVGVREVYEMDAHLVVALTDGSQLITDVAVVGIGVEPNVEWLATSGLMLDNGVVCDEFCRAVGQTNVWAVGDVARWWHPREAARRRIEHWTHACEQAAAAARNIANPGELTSYDPVDYVWSDQYDWRIQIAGRTGGDRACEIIGTPGEDRFAALYRDRTGKLSGAVTVNWQKAMLTIRRLLMAGAPSIGEARSAVTAARQRPVSAAT